MNIDLLNIELNELLQKHPHLMDLQLKFSKDLTRLDNPEDRMYYMSTELLDSFYELKEKLGELDGIFRSISC